MLHHAHCFYSYTEESYITQIEYGFHVHDVEIVDTAGQEEFLLFRDSSMTQGDAFLMVFAIDSISSWQHLKELRSKIIQEKDDTQIPMVIVANKRVSLNGGTILVACSNMLINTYQEEKNAPYNVHHIIRFHCCIK